MKTWILVFGCALLFAASLFVPAPQADAAPLFNDTAFQARWLRVDKPVEATSTAGRGYTWGPAVQGSNFTTERYNGSTRIVQYFDKARMEINNHNANPNDLFYVTTGLLVKELVTGKRQDGDNTFLPMQPSNVQIAGDPNDNGMNAIAPTYASFKNVVTFSGTQNGVGPNIGGTITAHIDNAGSVTYPTPPELRTYTVYDSVTQHNIADVFDRFNKQIGPVWNGSAYVQDSVFYNNSLYVLGHPVTEAYWTQAVVAGVTRNVLVQLFERRVLTYTPDNPDPYKVEMGNVGQHYFIWRYVRNQTCASPQPAPATQATGKFPADFSQYLIASLAHGGVPGGGVNNVLPYDLGANAIYSSPAISQDQKMAVVGTQNVGLMALAIGTNLNAICARWAYQPANTPAFDAPPLLYNGVAYIGAADGTFHAVDLSTGSSRWVNGTNTSPIHGQAITDGTNVYALAESGRIEAYRLSDGYRVWQTPFLSLGNKSAPRHAGPIFGFGGNIFFSWVDGKIYGYTASGAAVSGWATPKLPDPIIASPAFDGTNMYVGTVAGQLFVLNNSGTILANRKFGTRAHFNVPPVVIAGKVFFTTYAQGETPQVEGVTTDLSTIPFVASTGSSVQTALAIIDGYIYAGTLGGTVIRINANTGELTELVPAGSGTTFSRSSPAVANGQVYIGGDTGKFFIIK